ncbi:MAG: hypothetical protein M3016_09030 [Actinomycetota bacterium]|nr:hypothetical protein [Actinomycetota bacterium]
MAEKSLVKCAAEMLAEDPPAADDDELDVVLELDELPQPATSAAAMNAGAIAHCQTLMMTSSTARALPRALWF